MRHMSDAKSAVGTDWRLLGCSYVQVFVTHDDSSRRLLERRPLDLSLAIGRLAFIVAEEIYFPSVFGVETHTSYRAVESLRRHDPDFGAAWVRRACYRHQGLGLTLRPISRSRRVAGDIARMLCSSWAHQHDPARSSVRVCDIVPAMLLDLHAMLCHSSDAPTDP